MDFNPHNTVVQTDPSISVRHLSRWWAANMANIGKTLMHHSSLTVHVTVCQSPASTATVSRTRLGLIQPTTRQHCVINGAGELICMFSLWALGRGGGVDSVDVRQRLTCPSGSWPLPPSLCLLITAALRSNSFYCLITSPLRPVTHTYRQSLLYDVITSSK